MSERRYYNYEGLFLFPQAATSDLQAAADHVQSVLQRAETEIIAFRKWDDRRLAYEIAGNKRGVYFLVYFKAPADKLAGLERDCNLSEQMLRALITRADHLTLEQMQATEGREQLQDEIRLRAEQPAAIVEPDEPDDEPDDDDDDEPVGVDVIEEKPISPLRR